MSAATKSGERSLLIAGPVVEFLQTCALLEEAHRPGSAAAELRHAVDRGRWDTRGGLTVALDTKAEALLRIHAIYMRDSVANPQPAIDLLAVLDG